MSWPVLHSLNVTLDERVGETVTQWTTPDGEYRCLVTKHDPPLTVEEGWDYVMLTQLAVEHDPF